MHFYGSVWTKSALRFAQRMSKEQDSCRLNTLPMAEVASTQIKTNILATCGPCTGDLVRKLMYLIIVSGMHARLGIVCSISFESNCILYELTFTVVRNKSLPSHN